MTVKKWTGDRKACDICRADISRKPFFDAKTQMGSWGLLCAACFQVYGVGLGTGRGQSYNADGVKVAG